MTIAICLQDPDLSLSTGLSLPEEAYYIIGREPEGCIAGNNDNVRILIRQELQQGIGEILDADKRKFRHVKVFGMLTDGIGRHLLDETAAMWVNAYYDLKYAPGAGSAKRPVYDAMRNTSRHTDWRGPTSSTSRQCPRTGPRPNARPGCYGT